MCLISQSLKPFVAKKDLKVFKILNKDEKGNYETPYQHCKVELNSLMQANENSRDYSKYNWGDDGHKCQLEINGGFIHITLARKPTFVFVENKIILQKS